MDQRIKARGAFALIGEAGHEQNAEVGMVAGSGKRQCNAVHDRHAYVRQKEFEFAVFARQYVKRFGAVIGGHDLMAVEHECTGNERMRAIGVSINAGDKIPSVEEPDEDPMRFRRWRCKS
jgi:hypothetical protein